MCARVCARLLLEMLKKWNIYVIPVIGSINILHTILIRRENCSVGKIDVGPLTWLKSNDTYKISSNSHVPDTFIFKFDYLIVNRQFCSLLNKKKTPANWKEIFHLCELKKNPTCGASFSLQSILFHVNLLNASFIQARC